MGVRKRDRGDRTMPLFEGQCDTCKRCICKSVGKKIETTRFISPRAVKLLLTRIKKEGSGKLFSVTFRRRTDGQIREMNCRFGVKSKLKGGKASYDPKKKDLMVVWDVQAEGYRSIPREAVETVVHNGMTYIVTE